MPSSIPTARGSVTYQLAAHSTPKGVAAKGETGVKIGELGGTRLARCLEGRSLPLGSRTTFS